MCYSLLHYYYYILLLHTSYSYFIYIHTSYFEVCVNVLKLKNKLYLLATGYWLLLATSTSWKLLVCQQLVAIAIAREMYKIESRKSEKKFFYYFRFICLLVCSSSHFTISHITSSPLCNYINLSVSSTIIASYLLKRKE